VPLGAMVARGEIVDAVMAAGGFLHGFTYAGNPLACATGLAVIAEIERGDMMGNAARTGGYLKAQMAGLMDRFPFIGDVRGMGMLLAMEFVADRVTRVPLPPEIKAHERVVEAAYARGLIIYSRRSRGGFVGDHVLVCPPMITTPAQVDDIIGRLGDALAAFARDVNLPVAA
jgi:adenosylmethionine-8-amino-7-oxononanoate aminotransferase